MKRITKFAGLIFTTGIATSGHAQFVDQVGSSDSFNNTGVGSGVMSTLTLANESGCSDGQGGTSTGGNPGACSFNTAVGASALFSLTVGSSNTATGSQALYSNQSGSGNTAVGFQASYSNTGDNNTAFGLQTLFENQADDNSAFGAVALANNVTGTGNTAAGNAALSSNQTGSANSAVGSLALAYGNNGSGNTAVGANALEGASFYPPFTGASTGSDNTAVGANALTSFTSGSYDAAVGEGALQNMTSATNNTAFGYQALYHTTTGFGNAAQGASTLRANTTGYHNTGIGNAALGANTTGFNNTALGYDAGSAITGSNNIDIGNNGVASESGVIRIGTSGLQSSIYVQGIYNTSGLTGALPVVVTSTGQLGVGGSSSEHLKSDISAMGDATERLQELRPVSFHYKSDAQGALQYGLIAEDVAKVYPELVVRDGSGAIYGVRYDELAPMLLNEVQKQAAEIRDLKHQKEIVASQAAQIADLERQLAEIRAALVSGGH